MYKRMIFGTFGFNYILYFEDRKSLRIKVYPDASIEVLAPVHTQESEIYKKIRSKAPWVLKQLSAIKTFLPRTPAREFINGETHLYLGRQYRLKIEQSNVKSVKVHRGRLFIYSPDVNKKALIRLMDNWYKERANMVFSEILDAVLPKFKKYSINDVSLTIRRMNKRWGSCTPSGRITLNTELIRAHKGCIEYVIIHELCHLVYCRHDKSFYDLLSRMCPSWTKWKDRLEYSLS